MKEQATLLETSTAVVSTLDPETVLNRILEQMGRLLSIKMYAVISLDEEKGNFRIRAGRGLSKQFIEQLSIQPTALLVFHPTAHVFTHNEIQLLTSFANHAAMAIENALLFERSDMRLREQTHRLEALVQSLHDGLILSDLQGKVIYANKRVGDLANLSSKSLAG